MSEPTNLYIEIIQREGSPDTSALTSINTSVEKTEGWEERLMLKIAHALGFDDATSVEIKTPDGRFE